MMNTNNRSITRSLTVTVVALALAFGGFAVAHSLTAKHNGNAAGAAKLITTKNAVKYEHIPPAGISPNGNGWVITTVGLKVTSDGGKTFALAHTPIPLKDIYDVTVDGTHVRLAGVVAGAPVVEFSINSGATWTKAILPKGTTNARVARFVSYKGKLVGLLVTDVNSSNVSSGAWYATGDEGQTWKLSPMPASGTVTSTGSALWLSAFPKFSTLYRSLDQGVTWTEVSAPNGENSHFLSIAGQMKNGDVVLVASKMNASTETRFGVNLYVSHDLGVTWKLLARDSFSGQINAGEIPTASVVDDTIWLASPTDQKVTIFSATGKRIQTGDTGSIFPGGTIRAIAPSGKTSAWLVASKDSCTNGSSTCVDTGLLIKTMDAGRTWSSVNLGP